VFVGRGSGEAGGEVKGWGTGCWGRVDEVGEGDGRVGGGGGARGGDWCLDWVGGGGGEYGGGGADFCW